MARIRGTFPTANNFEPLKSGPLDARLIVETKIDLSNPTTWVDSSNNVWVYTGMSVAVTNDPSTANNGLYLLSDATNYANPSVWIKQGTGGSSSNLTFENVGTGTGMVFEDASNNLIKFRTLQSSGSLDITTSGDNIIIGIDASFSGRRRSRCGTAR